MSVRVTVAPEGGKANAAVCVVIARALRIPKGAVSVARGETSRHKQLEVAGVSEAEVERAFGRPADEDG